MSSFFGLQSTYNSIEDYVAHLGANETGRRLRIGDSTIADQDATAIADAIIANGRNSPQPSMEELCIVCVSLSRDGASGIFRAVGASAVKTLSVTFSPVFDDGAVALAEGLSNNKSLTAIGIQCSSRITAEGGAAIGRALRTNSTLLRLCLGSNAMACHAATEFAEGLARNRSLASLIMVDCDIGADGARALGNALEVNSTLEVLDLSTNPLGDDGVIGLADGLSQNKSLTWLYLTGCHIGVEGCESIGRATGRSQGST